MILLCMYYTLDNFRNCMGIVDRSTQTTFANAASLRNILGKRHRFRLILGLRLHLVIDGSVPGALGRHNPDYPFCSFYIVGVGASYCIIS